MKPSVAIIVGHYGPGTGASYPVPNTADSSIDTRDEFILAHGDAVALYRKLQDEGRIEPMFFSIDNRLDPWKWVPLNTSRQLQTKLNWLADKRPDVAIELHYNSHKSNPSGNEIVYKDGSIWTQCIDKALIRLPNRHRDAKISNKMIFRAACPTVIAEPAFLCEDPILRSDWRAKVVSALAVGIYDYFKEA